VLGERLTTHKFVSIATTVKS